MFRATITSSCSLSRSAPAARALGVVAALALAGLASSSSASAGERRASPRSAGATVAGAAASVQGIDPAEASSAIHAEFRSGEELLSQKANATQLARKDVDPDRDAPSALDLAADPQFSADMRISYDIAARNQGEREQHQLVDANERRAFFERTQVMAHVYMTHIQNRQARALGQKLESALEREPDARAPMQVAAVLIALYTGRALKLRPAADVTVSLRSQLSERSGSLEVTSPMGDTRVEVLPKSEERTRLTLSRGIPEWAVSGGVSVTGNNVVTASVTKQVVKHLDAVYESRLRAGDTFRLVYALTF